MYLSQKDLYRFQRVQARLNRLDAGESQVLAVPGTVPPHGDIIVFAGSFNPPTVAHIGMLKQAQQFARQRQKETMLYAAFSRRTVDKESVERPLLLDRIVLLQNILRTRFPQGGILLFKQGLYVEQAQALRISFPRVERIFFLMGYDKIVQVLDARYYDDRDATLTELFRQANLLVAPRGDGGVEEIVTLIHQPENERFARSIHSLPLDTSYREISSTQVRQADAGSALLREVPWEVRQFMRKTRAYAPTLMQSNGTLIDRYEERVNELQRLLREPL